MSATEPQVRVLYRPGESLTPGYSWAWECEACDDTGGYWRDREDCERYAAEHETACVAIRLARWDSRDTALRALVDEWRERTVTVMPSALTAADTERLTWGAAADELERAIGVEGC